MKTKIKIENGKTYLVFLKTCYRSAGAGYGLSLNLSHKTRANEFPVGSKLLAKTVDHAKLMQQQAELFFVK